jgi:hypothetical protein
MYQRHVGVANKQRETRRARRRFLPPRSVVTPAPTRNVGRSAALPDRNQKVREPQRF